MKTNKDDLRFEGMERRRKKRLEALAKSKEPKTVKDGKDKK